MGALYLASKLEECPLRMRDVINVYDVLIQRSRQSKSSRDFKYEPMSYFSQDYYDMKDVLIIAEMQLLKRLGFDVHVTLPYGTLVNYMRVLNLLEDTKACQMAWCYLNDAYVHYSYRRWADLILVKGYKLRYMRFTPSQSLSAQPFFSSSDIYNWISHLLKKTHLRGGTSSMPLSRMYGLSPASSCVYIGRGLHQTRVE